MFKVGDRVWCIKDDMYGITDYHVKCTVTKERNKDGKIRVAVNGRRSYGDYPVLECLFEKYKTRVV